MNHDETIKLAYGIGCITTMRQAGVDPAEFCKLAAQTDDADLFKMADAVAAVYNYANGAPEHQQYAEKVASVVFEPQTEKQAFSPVEMFRKGYGMPGVSEFDLLKALEGTGALDEVAARAGRFVGTNPGTSAAIGAGVGAPALAAAGYGAHQAMQPEEPWYQRAASGLSDVFGG
jgi:hypothetical protein